MNLVHLTAASHLATIDGIEKGFSIARELLLLRGVCEIWFDADAGQGHELLLDGTRRAIGAVPPMAELRRLWDDWERPGVTCTPWQGGHRIYAHGRNGTWYRRGSLVDFTAEFGEALELPPDRIARFWYPGHTHYLMRPDGTLVDADDAWWEQGARLLASVEAGACNERPVRVFPKRTELPALDRR
ncbi:MAG: hypothetical protein AB7N54_15060 [Alphaproteobacteria bacterium]